MLFHNMKFILIKILSPGLEPEIKIVYDKGHIWTRTRIGETKALSDNLYTICP